MRWPITIYAAFAAVVSCHSVQAAELIPVAPIPGSTFTVVFDINDNNVVAGCYGTSDGILHGFFGPLNGLYTTFDYGDTSTTPRGINNEGYITGIADKNGNGIEFERYPNGEVKTITKDGIPLLNWIVQGINKRGVFVGNYYDESNNRHAYYGRKGQYRSELTLPDGSQDPEPRGINDRGAVVGHTFNQGFLLKDGTESIIDYPDQTAAWTFLQDINNAGVITGYWDDENFDADHPFVFETKTSTFKPIEIPHSISADALGTNSAGLVAISSDVGAFIYCPHSKRSGKCPAGGVEIPDPRPIHVPFGKMLRFAHTPNERIPARPSPELHTPHRLP